MTGRLARSIYPFVGLVVIVAAWQAYVDVFNVNPVVLPSPAAIFEATVVHFSELVRHTWPTFVECILGFALAIGIGIPIAVALSSSTILNLTLYPILIAMQSVPKVAVAPIILVWFGLGIESKLAIAFLVAFFPIVVDTATGLNATPVGLLELAKSLRASRWQIFWKVQLPSALPFVFAGAKVAVTLTVIGAVIGEFVGSSEGLGFLLLRATSQLDSPLAFAALFALSFLGMFVYVLVELAERLAAPWLPPAPQRH
jgi:NitT/TauT family transport system permease protein